MQIQVKKARTSRSLMITLAVAFFTLSLIVLLIASSFQIYFNFQTQQKLVAREQQLIAQDAANTVRGFIQDKFDILEIGAKFGNLANTQKGEQKLVLEKLVGLKSDFRQVVLFDAQEQELLTISRVSDVMSGQFSELDKIKMFSQVSQRKRYISSVYIDKITSEPEVIMAVPVTDVFGNFQGTLMTEVNLKFMWDLVDRIKIGKTGVAYVVDRQGNLIAFGDNSRVLRGENLIHLNEVDKFVNGQESLTGSGVSEGILGTDVVANYVPLGMPDWAVIVELPVVEAYEPVNQGIFLSVGVITLSTILAVVAGIYLSKRITNPIKKLTKNIEDISMGKLDVDIDPKIKNSQDEIGALARAFDRTIVSLKMAMRKTKGKKEARGDVI